ncbi:ATP-binding protein [Vibrio vulnificus]|nr:response regulator [Vibrio vulnificus]EIV8483906.1 response regulator [Vibrio vulnificus]EJE8534304.1 response regulator [Vibrio vulnificus]
MMKLSIKTRLALLSLLPAIFISGFTVQELVNNRRQLESLDKTISRIHIQNGITETAFKIYQGVEGDMHYLDELTSSDSFNLFMASLSQNSDLVGLQAELIESLSEIKSQPDEEKLISAEWGFDVLQEMLDQVHNQHSHLYSDRADTTEMLISQLISLSFWAQKEALLTYKLQHDGKNAIDAGTFYQAIVHQQQALERFLDIGASHLQVEKLLEFFSSERYQSSVQDRDAIAAGNITKEELSVYAVELDYRLQTLLLLINSFSIQAEAELRKEIEQQQWYFTMMTGAVFSVLFILFTLGTSTWLRVYNKLNAILNALQSLTKEDEKSQQTRVIPDGNDEFTVFAKQINQIIDEKQQQMVEIIHAKESAISANRAKSVFLANMSHEIRTPLNGIIGMTEILSQSELTGPQKEILGDIDTSSQSLLILLNDILDLSKIESGNLNISLQEADIRETVYQAMTLFQSKATSKNIELHVTLGEDIPAKVLADDHRLKQVLTNLIGNAIKFTKEGYISTFANYHVDETGAKGHLTFKVTDTGIGIEQEKLETIFEPFTQEDDSITRQFGGTGLGLAICRQLVAMMGGELTATSTKGLGSCFSFTIPVERLPGEVWRSKVIKKGVLIAENYGYTNQLVNECRLAGIELTIAEEVEQASLLKKDFDVVFYCHSLHQNASNDLEVLEQSFPLQRVIVCQHHLFASHINPERIHAILTQPFLGLRFKASIESLEKKSVPFSIVSDTVPPRPTTSIVQGYGRHQRRILIAEDNLMNQKIASFFLEKAGFDYLITSNGQEALDAITQGGKFDAVLMDCMMPVMDGITATREIRRWETEQGNGKTPIIALTASVLEEDIQSCFEAGMDAYLPKPYKSNQLYDLFSELKIA